MRNTIRTSMVLLVVAVTLILTACQKAQEANQPTPPQTPKEVVRQKQEPQQINQPGQAEPPQATTRTEEKKKAVAKPSPLTMYEQWIFRGRHPEPSLISEREALKDLRILVKGDPSTIHWYKEHEKELHEGINFWYQQDISTCVTALGWAKNEKGYDLILQVLANKTDYPKALASAAEAAGMYGEFKDGKWYGDKRAIPYLKNIINSVDPEVRLRAAGSLLGAGEGDIALPILNETIKAGTSKSRWAILYLFSPEEIIQNGEKNVIISNTKLLDERGKDILRKTLNYPSNEIKTEAAFRLASMGMEREACEKLSLNILERFKKTRLENYGYNPKDGVPDSRGKAALFYSDSRSCDSAIATLGVLKSKKAIQVLGYIGKNNTDWYFVCKGDNANKALSSINRGER